MERLVHDVYFTLEDSSAVARAALVELCHEHLAGHDGIVFFAAGTREESHRRDVNDDAYHVSLHICFESKAAHDVYQDTEAHQRFIDAGSANWPRCESSTRWCGRADSTRGCAALERDP